MDGLLVPGASDQKVAIFNLARGPSSLARLSDSDLILRLERSVIAHSGVFCYHQFL